MPPKLCSAYDTPEGRRIFHTSDRPYKRTIEEWLADPVEMELYKEFESRVDALPGGPMFRESCDICQSSPFESQVNKDATHTRSELRKHKKKHHCDSATFNTWLLFHHKHSSCYACTICQGSHPSARRLQLHLLDKHQDDNPHKLPVELYNLSFWTCMSSKSATTRAEALTYRKVVEGHAAAAVEKRVLARIRGESSRGGGKAGKASAENTSEAT